jgi:hypothetical protein
MAVIRSSPDGDVHQQPFRKIHSRPWLAATGSEVSWQAATSRGPGAFEVELPEATQRVRQSGAERASRSRHTIATSVAHPRAGAA